jgi:eukaryotic-like serine/threonine-protein kinase
LNHPATQRLSVVSPEGPSPALQPQSDPRNGIDLLEGETVSLFHIEACLGGGGMGVVYRATDTKLGRRVALKFLPPDLTRDQDARERFLNGARAASALDHPHTCMTCEIGEPENSRTFLAMAGQDPEAGDRTGAVASRPPAPVVFFGGT